MKTKTMLSITAALLGGVASGIHAEDIPLQQCPEPVITTIKGHMGPGRIDEIKTIRIENRVLYLAEIDLPGKRERKLHVSGDGSLLKVVEESRLSDLPPAVRSALQPFLAKPSRFDSADKITASGKTEYHVEIDLPDDVDLKLVLDESGKILRRTEEADY